MAACGEILNGGGDGLNGNIVDFGGAFRVVFFKLPGLRGNGEASIHCAGAPNRSQRRMPSSTFRRFFLHSNLKTKSGGSRQEVGVPGRGQSLSASLMRRPPPAGVHHYLANVMLTPPSDP